MEIEMPTKTVAFKEELLRDIDRVAREESRSRSELLRGAARAYINRKDRWNSIFNIGERLVERCGLTPEDVSSEIREHRVDKGSLQ